MCVRSRGQSLKLARKQARKDQTEQERGIEEKGADEWVGGKRDDGGKKGGKKGSKGSKPDWYGDKEGKVKRKNVAILAQAILAQGVFCSNVCCLLRGVATSG